MYITPALFVFYYNLRFSKFLFGLSGLGIVQIQKKKTKKNNKTKTTLSKKKQINDNCRIRTCAGRAQKISNLTP